jgi:hypothetical protein
LIGAQFEGLLTARHVQLGYDLTNSSLITYNDAPGKAYLARCELLRSVEFMT